MQLIAPYQDAINAGLRAIPYPLQPAQLYDPIRYFSAIGGKRIRPVLTLLAAEMFGLPRQESLPAALAIETFHNFTLLHDDLMDNAPLRRGQPSVHEKWSPSIAILSGDAMLITAYQQLAQVNPRYLPEVLSIFNQVAIEVCEGQQLDLDFEDQEKVDIPQYLEMIRLKTAVLLGAALKIGAVLAGASEKDATALEAFGINIGIAFQLQDDYLDVYGETETFGKEIGGDILAGKKTYLWLKAMELAPADLQEQLKYWNNKSDEPVRKVETITEIYNTLSIPQHSMEVMRFHAQQAEKHLDSIDLPEVKKSTLKHLAEKLMNRST